MHFRGSMEKEDSMVNYEKINNDVQECIKDAGRESEDVTLIAVSKTVGENEVSQAIEQGATDFAENRPEELVRKSTSFPTYNWHFIGNIQSRQIKNIVPHACMIHSLFDLSHASKINDIAASLSKIQRVLVEVDISKEESKSGVLLENLDEFLKELNKLKNIEVCGLMTMAPIQDESHSNLLKPEQVFKICREEVDKYHQIYGESFKEMSAGMTNDWKDAIRCGSTMLRIGRAIFS